MANCEQQMREEAAIRHHIQSLTAKLERAKEALEECAEMSLTQQSSVRMRAKMYQALKDIEND